MNLINMVNEHLKVLKTQSVFSQSKLTRTFERVMCFQFVKGFVVCNFCSKTYEKLFFHFTSPLSIYNSCLLNYEDENK